MVTAADYKLSDGQTRARSNVMPFPLQRDKDGLDLAQLSQAYAKVLDDFAATGLRHISFPAVDFEFDSIPEKEIATTTWRAIRVWLEGKSCGELGRMRITLVLSDNKDYQNYTAALLEQLPE